MKIQIREACKVRIFKFLLTRAYGQSGCDTGLQLFAQSIYTWSHFANFVAAFRIPVNYHADEISRTGSHWGRPPALWNRSNARHSLKLNDCIRWKTPLGS